MTTKHLRLFDRFELDEAYSQVAAGWFYYGNADKAFQLASAVAERSGQEIPTSHWTAGLAAWSLNNTSDAARQFELLASSDKASALTHPAQVMPGTEMGEVRGISDIRERADLIAYLRTLSDDPVPLP